MFSSGVVTGTNTKRTLPSAISKLHRWFHGFREGIYHGFAGSGALVVLLVAAAPSTGAALGFLAAFCALSIATMGAVSSLWGRALGTAFPRHLEAAADVLGVVVGASLVAEHVVAIGLL